MVSKKVTIVNEQGMHMRPASQFAKAMTPYDCDVTIVFNGNQINGKSLMNIIGACIKCGAEIEIQCSGADEEKALDEAVGLIQGGFQE